MTSVTGVAPPNALFSQLELSQLAASKLSSFSRSVEAARKMLLATSDALSAEDSACLQAAAATLARIGQKAQGATRKCDACS